MRETIIHQYSFDDFPFYFIEYVKYRHYENIMVDVLQYIQIKEEVGLF